MNKIEQMRRTVPWKKKLFRELTVKNISQFYLCDLCDICNFLITLKDNKWKRVYQKKSNHTRSTNFRKKKFYFINDNYYNDVRQIVVIFLSPNSFLLLEAGCSQVAVRSLKKRVVFWVAWLYTAALTCLIFSSLWLTFSNIGL